MLRGGDIDLSEHTAMRARDVPVAGSVAPQTRIYLHIQKTGGSSINHLIYSHLPKSRFVAIYPDRGLSIPQLVSLPLAQPQSFELIIGHTYCGIDKYIGNSAKYVTLLRDPVARLHSQVKHVLQYQGPNHADKRRAVSGSYGSERGADRGIRQSGG
jgi:hypothetical protein